MKNKIYITERYLCGFFSALIFSLVFFSLFLSNLYAQAMINLKMINLKNNESFSLGDFERGKVWVERENKNIFIYDGEETKSFSIKEDVFLPTGEASFENGNLTVKKWYKEEEEKEKKSGEKMIQRVAPKFLWELNLKEINLSMATTDIKGENLFVADQDGDIHVFDIADKEYRGRLRFLKKSIKHLKTLNNGGLVIIYDGSIVCYIENFKIPIFSFLQDLKSSYQLKKIVKIPLNFISSFSINNSQDRAVLAGDHKTIIILDLPTLTYKNISEEKLFIEFADFVDDDRLIYMTLKVRGFTDNTTTFRSHFTFMENYFDLRKMAILSPSGRFMLRISEKDSLDIFDLITPFKVGTVTLEQKRLGDVFFGNDNRTFIITDKKKERLALYRLIDQKN